MTEYTGQCRGGPDDGNLITATVPMVSFEVTYRRRLDGPEGDITSEVVCGVYRWRDGVFVWELIKPWENRPDENMPITERAWGQIPAGWFVKAPDGAWWEIVSTSRAGDRQDVTFRPKGRSLRPVAAMVTCRPGTNPSEAGQALARAMSTFEGTFPRVEIIEDQVS